MGPSDALYPPPPVPWKRPFQPVAGSQTETPTLSPAPGWARTMVTSQWAGTGIGGTPGIWSGPAGTSTPVTDWTVAPGTWGRATLWHADAGAAAEAGAAAVVDRPR